MYELIEDDTWDEPWDDPIPSDVAEGLQAAGCAFINTRAVKSLTIWGITGHHGR
jgi:hypothetical protein